MLYVESHQNVNEHGVRQGLIVAGVMAATLMQTLDSTITNVALPTIQGNIGASLDEATWVVTAYTIAAIIVIPITPWLQNRFGRRNYYIASIVGFTIASVMCGVSDSLGLLTFWRVVQGLFGGGLLATGQLILRDTFPPERLGVSQGIFTVGAVLGPALGPPLGGILVDNWSWNWCFDINVIPGAFAAIVLFILLRDPQKPQRLPVDLAGVILLALSLGSMQYVLTEGEQHYWLADPVNLFMTILCIMSSAAFVTYELKGTNNPIVDLRILANRSVWAGSLLALALGMAMIGSTYVIPQFTQGPLGFTPTLSGLLFVLRAIPVLLAIPVIVMLIGKIDARWLVGLGFVLMGGAMVMLAFTTTLETSFWTFGVPLVLSGAAISLLFTPLMIAVLGATSPQQGQKAGAFINLAVQLGGSWSVAILDVLTDRREEFHSSILSASATLANPAVHAFLRTHTLAALSQIVDGQSVILSYADASYFIGVTALLCIPLVLLMRKRKGHVVDHAEIEVGG
jgi:MFS transporter, DHA2 family, multidrug resistance protein